MIDPPGGVAMGRRYVTVDVFTDHRFGGNPLAVVLDAQGLTGAQMQAVATEFNYSETTFLLPPLDPQHTARVRIFTARTEVPFAGHPNVGTAVVWARERQARGDALPADLVFEEAAGLVPIRLLMESGTVVGAEITAPERLSVGSSVSRDDAAACVGLSAQEVVDSRHPPQVTSVGLPFLTMELCSREALRRAKPQLPAHERILPAVGTDAVFAYVRGEEEGHLYARMFAPLDATIEDPATGSAAAATIALLTELHAQPEGKYRWRIEQGHEMGRPSLILGRTEKKQGRVAAVHIGGQAVSVMRGVLQAE